jgi:hypothetical protein
VTGKKGLKMKTLIEQLHTDDVHENGGAFSCTSPTAGSADITVESILKLGSELDEFLRKSWIEIFKHNGFNVEEGDKCLVSKFSKSLFPNIPKCFASQIIVSDFVPEGTAAVFMKNYNPLNFNFDSWNKPNTPIQGERSDTLE